MKNKASLSLMELLIMVLVFAIAASVCLRGFVYARQTSEAIDQQGQAVILAQNTAETLKAYHGSFEDVADTLGGTQDETRLTICYNEQWEPIQESSDWVYRLEVEKGSTDLSELGKAEIRVTQMDGRLLYTLTVGWQEVG